MMTNPHIAPDHALVLALRRNLCVRHERRNRDLCLRQVSDLRMLRHRLRHLDDTRNPSHLRYLLVEARDHLVYVWSKLEAHRRGDEEYSPYQVERLRTQARRLAVSRPSFVICTWSSSTSTTSLRRRFSRFF